MYDSVCLPRELKLVKYPPRVWMGNGGSVITNKRIQGNVYVIRNTPSQKFTKNQKKKKIISIYNTN